MLFLLIVSFFCGFGHYCCGLYLQCASGCGYYCRFLFLVVIEVIVIVVPRVLLG